MLVARLIASPRSAPATPASSQEVKEWGGSGGGTITQWGNCYSSSSVLKETLNNEEMNTKKQYLQTQAHTIYFTGEYGCIAAMN